MKSLIIIVSVFLTLNVAGQRVVIPAYHNPYIIHYEKHNGYIALNNGKKIESSFQYAFWEFPTYNLKSFLENGKLIKRYKPKDIKTVVLAGSDSVLTKHDSTYFKVLSKRNFFYRQLTFGSIELYDNFLNVDETIGLVKFPLSLKNHNQLYELSSEKKFITWMKTNYPNKIKWHDGIKAEEIIKQLNGMQ